MSEEYKSIVIREIKFGEFEISGIKGNDIYRQILPEALSAVKELNSIKPVRLDIGKIVLYINSKMTLRDIVNYFDKEYYWETGMMVD